MSRETQAAKKRQAETKKRHAEKAGRVPVDESKIRSSGFGPGPWIPEYYEDVAFTCKDCGSRETWTATQQKWWYEVAGGLFETTKAVRCRKCRAVERARKEEARRVHREGVKKKQASPAPKSSPPRREGSD